MNGMLLLAPDADDQRHAVVLAIVDNLMLFRIIEIPDVARSHRNKVILDTIQALRIRLQNDVELRVVIFRVPALIDVRRDLSARRNLRDQHAAEASPFDASHQSENDLSYLGQ